MRKYEDIIKNSKLTILTELNNKETTGEIQIRANYNDPLTRKSYWCKFTSAHGWEHLTVSGRNKVPDWSVMCACKDIFWDDEECCVEYHPRKSQYVNNNENCLHIWKQIGVEFPEPSTFLLGFQDMSSSETSNAIHNVLNMLSMDEKKELANKLGIRVGNRSLKRGNGFKR